MSFDSTPQVVSNDLSEKNERMCKLNNGCHVSGILFGRGPHV